MTGPDQGAVAGRGRMRAAHADRDQVIEELKAAFVQGRLAKPEFDERVGGALTSRTYAELDALAADIPRAPRAAGIAGLPAGLAAAGAPPAPRPRTGTLAKASRRSAICMLIAVTLWTAGVRAENFGMLLAGFIFVMASTTFFGYGCVDAWEERRARGLPPRPGTADGRPGAAGELGNGNW